MLHTLRFFFSKCRLFHNATFFGSCVIHILYTGRAKIKKKIRPQRVNIYKRVVKCVKQVLHNYFTSTCIEFQPATRNEIYYLIRKLVTLYSGIVKEFQISLRLT